MNPPNQYTTDQKSKITCVLISDSQSRHSEIASLPAGDILIHAGDITEHGTIEEIEQFVVWFSAQPYSCKLFVAGNHDHSLEPGHNYNSALRLLDPIYANYHTASTSEESQRLIQKLEALRQSGIIYLHPNNPSAKITIRGRELTIFGLPHTPTSFGPNAFMNDQDCDDPWLKAPEKADILISHSPPLGFRDTNINGKHQGCDRLKGAIYRIKPKLVVCGHVHEARGTTTTFWGEGGSTEVVNAALMDRSKSLTGEAQIATI